MYEQPASQKIGQLKKSEKSNLIQSVTFFGRHLCRSKHTLKLLKTTSTCESMACRRILQFHNLVVVPVVAVVSAVAVVDPIAN